MNALIVLSCMLLLLSSSATRADSGARTNLLSWGSGALVVNQAAYYDEQWHPHFLLDDDPSTGWGAPDGETSPQEIVIEMAERSRLDALAFDNAGVDTDLSAAQAVRAEIADATTGPWSLLGEFSLVDRRDAQHFAFEAQTGRYVRLTISSNHGHARWTELMGAAAFGEAVTQTAPPEISGAFDTGLYGTFRLAQQGVTADGRYEYDGGRIQNGGFEGRVLRFVWTETNDEATVQQQGSALMIFHDGGNAFSGYWWDGDAKGRIAGIRNGVRTSVAPGRCTHWAPGGNDVALALQGQGRARLYGILFDVDSDRIRADSQPTLDALVAAARDNPAWTLDIEGHTDASGSASYNQALSGKRADAVRTHLVAAGIDADRLASSGFGASVPVASNDTTAGRSQNRRVEIVRR